MVLFTQHPVTTEYGDGISQVLKTIDALGRFNDVHVIALFSNADAGGRRIIERLQQESYSIHPSIPHEDFLSLMSIADVMVGNFIRGNPRSAELWPARRQHRQPTSRTATGGEHHRCSVRGRCDRRGARASALR